MALHQSATGSDGGGKREPGMGWTVNLAHPKGGPILISMLLAPAVLSMLVIALVHGTGAACG